MTTQQQGVVLALAISTSTKSSRADYAVMVCSADVYQVEMKNVKTALEQNDVSKCKTCFHGYFEITANKEKRLGCPGTFSVAPFFRFSSCHGDSRSAQHNLL